ncbi:RNA-binding domain-containing protein [Hugenholtzia roseola]|uniref:RNA-binding domain-containing protein n=1 Tax=Hugenholtzia roseola TaxID=1002 RepID=UPI0003FD1683|nr:RNA-binding domain-containing protein [Hugenholtzia roseola]
MLTAEEVKYLLNNPDAEIDRIEFTESTKAIEKFSEAICAFSNDYPDHKKAGYLFIGVKKDGTLSGLKITDELQKDVASIRNNGQILPQPALSMAVFDFPQGQVLVVEVLPAFHPPTLYKGKPWIRVGASKAVANETEERRLIEKRTATARTFDALPCWEAHLDDLALDLIKLSYFPLAIDNTILIENHRDFKQQLASLRLYDLKHDKPTNVAILLFGLNPIYFFSGAYIQYVKVAGKERDLEQVLAEKAFKGSLFDVLKEIDGLVKNQIVVSRPIRRQDSFQDTILANYPYQVLRELVMNAIMHRSYESTAPIYIYEFSDRIEIRNAGGLYGEVNAQNFPNQNAYRNPIIAEAMKNLKYINRFNFGIPFVQKFLADNGLPLAVFDISSPSSFSVTLQINPQWQNA